MKYFNLIGKYIKSVVMGLTETQAALITVALLIVVVGLVVL